MSKKIHLVYDRNNKNTLCGAQPKVPNLVFAGAYAWTLEYYKERSDGSYYPSYPDERRLCKSCKEEIGMYILYRQSKRELNHV